MVHEGRPFPTRTSMSTALCSAEAVCLGGTAAMDDGTKQDGKGEERERDGALLEAYRTHLRVLNRSPDTVRAYANGAERFLAFVRGKGVEALREVGEELLEEHQGKVLREHANLATVDTYMRAVHAFLKFLVRRNVIVLNPGDLVPLPKVPRRLPRFVLSVEEAERLMSAPDVETDKGVLHRAVLELFYSTALRLGELCRLELDDVDTAKGVVRVRKGKGGKDRVAPMGNSACLWVRLYRETVRAKKAEPEEERFFLGQNSGRPINPQIVQRLVRAYGKKVGIVRPVSPHTLRATAATHMVKGGAGILEAKDFLGHSMVETTTRYVSLAAVDLVEAHRQFHPREQP
jgi:integrase/recombinase XerD